MSSDISCAAWRTSSYSNGGGKACVEVAVVPGVVGVRDSTDRSGPALMFTSRSWVAFIAEVVEPDPRR